MNIYTINAHDFRLGGGNATIAAPDVAEAIRAFGRTEAGGALLEKTTGIELRIFKSSEGVVLQSEIQNPNKVAPDECLGTAVPPPPPEAMPQPQPEPTPPKNPLNDFLMVIAALAACAACGAKPKRKPKRKK